MTGFVLCCEAKRGQQQPQRACNTFRVTLTSYFINRRGQTGAQTVQLMGFVPLRGKPSQERKHWAAAATTLAQTLVLCTAQGMHRKSSPGNGFCSATLQHLDQVKSLGLDLLGVIDPAANSSSHEGCFGPRLKKFKFP